MATSVQRTGFSRNRTEEEYRNRPEALASLAIRHSPPVTSSALEGLMRVASERTAPGLDVVGGLPSSCLKVDGRYMSCSCSESAALRSQVSQESVREPTCPRRRITTCRGGFQRNGT